MSNTELLNALSEIGLTQYEAKVYNTLVTEGVSTAKDISNICGIPYGKIYEIINALTSKGYVITLPTKPMKYRALHPQKVIGLVKEHNERKIQTAEKVISAELNSVFEKNREFVESKGLFWVINGRSAIAKKTEELFDKAKKHIYIFTSELGLNRLKYYSEVLRELSKNGVEIRVSAKLTKNNLEAQKYLKFCKLCDIAHETKNNFVSIDGKESVVFEPIPDDENVKYGRDLGIWITNPSFTGFIENFFNINHENSK